jgi:translation initiation factor 1 (eIF-1/SUI1)
MREKKSFKKTEIDVDQDGEIEILTRSGTPFAEITIIKLIGQKLMELNVLAHKFNLNFICTCSR